MSEINKFYQKLAKAKKTIGAISKDSTNPFFKSKYFDINTLLAAVEPELEKEGLLVIQPIIEGNVHTKIIDSETGSGIDSSLKLSDQKDPQKLGSEITYFRRYTLQSLLSLQAEDDDGNKASKPSPKGVKFSDRDKTQDGKKQVKNLPKLTPVSEKWDGAKVALHDGSIDIEGIRKHYSLTDENAELLIK